MKKSESGQRLGKLQQKILSNYKNGKNRLVSIRKLFIHFCALHLAQDRLREMAGLNPIFKHFVIKDWRFLFSRLHFVVSFCPNPEFSKNLFDL